MKPAALLIFAKYPVPGEVKTRLASDIGPEAATLLYRHFVQVIIQKLARHRSIDEAIVAVAQSDQVHRFAIEFPGAYRYLPQQANRDLGVRLQDAIAQQLASGFGKVVVVGTDSPQMPSRLVTEALAALRTADVVLGPATDGGYYLIAVKGDYPALFRGIEWSTDQVLAQTLAAAEQAGLAVHLLEQQYDVDTLAELQQLAREHPALVAASGVFELVPALRRLLQAESEPEGK